MEGKPDGRRTKPEPLHMTHLSIGGFVFAVTHNTPPN
jgi:hypothetical protein